MFLRGNRLQEGRQWPLHSQVASLGFHYGGIVFTQYFTNHFQMCYAISQDNPFIWLCGHWISPLLAFAPITRRKKGVGRLNLLSSCPPLLPRLTVFVWCSEFPSCLAPFEIGYNVEGLSTKLGSSSCMMNSLKVPEDGSNELRSKASVCLFFWITEAVKVLPVLPDNPDPCSIEFLFVSLLHF